MRYSILVIETHTYKYTTFQQLVLNKYCSTEAALKCWHYRFTFWCNVILSGLEYILYKSRQKKDKKRESDKLSHNTVIKMQLTLTPAAHTVPFHVTVASCFSRWESSCQIMCLQEKQHREVNRAAQRLKAKSTDDSFHLSFTLRNSPAVYWFLFLLPTVSGKQQYFTCFNELKQFITSEETSNRNRPAVFPTHKDSNSIERLFSFTV